MTATEAPTDQQIFAWAFAQATYHSPTERNGYSCDEQGCGICNADSPEDYARAVVAVLNDPDPRFGPWLDAPDLEECQGAIEALAEGGVEIPVLADEARTS